MSSTNISPSKVAKITTNTFDAVVDALRDVHDEASLWHLADELVKVAPSGVADVERVVSLAKQRGIPTKSANTLRLYRDVAIRFPEADRVPLVSFSAHREAIAIGDVKQARKVLEDLSAAHGAAGVTVTTVKQAVGAITGKTPAAPKAKQAATSYADVAADLSAGGKKMIAELPAMVATNGVTLDGLAAGLNAVLTEVESMRSKAARKASAAKRSANAKKAPAKPSGAKAKAPARKPRPKASAGKAGDLRGL